MIIHRMTAAPQMSRHKQLRLLTDLSVADSGVTQRPTADGRNTRWLTSPIGPSKTLMLVPGFEAREAHYQLYINRGNIQGYKEINKNDWEKLDND